LRNPPFFLDVSFLSNLAVAVPFQNECYEKVRYQFENCVLDVDRHELTRDGETIAVEPQVFKVIHLLAREQGNLVSSDQIVSEVWKGRIVSDSAISSRINAARKAVGDDGKAQRIIKTVARLGFQMVVPVKVEAAGGGENAGQEEPVQPHHSVKFTTSKDGTSIAYAMSGQGPKIMRAGHFMTHLEYDWSSPIWRPYLEAIGKQYTIVRYDQRGTGLSDRELRGTGIEEYADDLKAVADAAGLERFPLIATSQGVPVAIHFAANNPERVEKLILVGGYAIGRILRDPNYGSDETNAMLAMIRAGWGRPNSGFMMAFTALFCPSASSDEIASLAEIQSASASSENAAIIRDAIDRFDVSDLLEKISAPTLVVHSDEDAVHPISQGQLIARNVSGAEFMQINSTNHVLMPSHPTFRDVIQAQLDFLSRQ